MYVFYNIIANWIVQPIQLILAQKHEMSLIKSIAYFFFWHHDNQVEVKSFSLIQNLYANGKI